MLKPIPFTRGFFAGDDNEIYSPDKEKRTQYTNGDGYKTASVLLEDGRWVTFGVHRLVALAFHQPKTEHTLLTVNHIDGDKCNNLPFNLEWITNKKNVIHGVLLNKESNRPLIYCENSQGEIFYLEDLMAAAIHFTTDVETVWKNICEHTTIDGWCVKHLSCTDKRLTKLKVIKPGEITTWKRKLLMFDLENSEITSFNSLWDAARFFNVLATHIRIRVSTPGYPKIFRSRYVFVDEAVGFDFLTDDVKAALLTRTGAKPIIVYNLTTKEFAEYKSANYFISVTPGVSKKAITTRLKKGSLKPFEHYITKVIDDIDHDKELILEMARSL